MSSARCPVVVLQPQSPFPHFGHRALRMALSAPREAWGFIEDSSYGPTVDQYPASPPVSPQAFPETPGPRVSSHSRGARGLAWERVRGTRSLVYPPLLSRPTKLGGQRRDLFAPTIGFAGLPSFIRIRDPDPLVRIHSPFISRRYRRDCPAATPEHLHNNLRNTMVAGFILGDPRKPWPRSGGARGTEPGTSGFGGAPSARYWSH
jgi:hypothetical protein